MLGTKEKLNRELLLNIFTCKKEQKTGMEYERLPVLKKNFMAADYDAGIREFLRIFAREDNWDYLIDDYNIIGLKQEHDTITLEPGCQIELSLKPENTICDLEKKFNILNKKINKVLENLGITLLNYGVSPFSTYHNINIIPKQRYKIMAKYLWGILSDVMMRETAGIQGCFDFSSEEDAIRKFKLANKLTPFMTAMFANSPIRGGVETGYKTFRGLSWLNTDNDRCGFACNLDDDFSFSKYISSVLETPIIFLKKNDENIFVNGKINFDTYMKSGYEGYEATLDDFLLQANLYFPEVRLRNFLEIRNHDCCKMPFAILAIYKGILYNSSAMNEIEELLKPYSNNDFIELRYSIVKDALQSKIKNYLISDIAKDIVTIAEKYLKETKEEKYLAPIQELVYAGMSPADVIIQNWNGIWNKNPEKLIKYLTV